MNLLNPIPYTSSRNVTAGLVASTTACSLAHSRENLTRGRGIRCPLSTIITPSAMEQKNSSKDSVVSPFHGFLNFFCQDSAVEEDR